MPCGGSFFLVPVCQCPVRIIEAAIAELNHKPLKAKPLTNATKKNKTCRCLLQALMPLQLPFIIHNVPVMRALNTFSARCSELGVVTLCARHSEYTIWSWAQKRPSFHEPKHNFPDTCSARSCAGLPSTNPSLALLLTGIVFGLDDQISATSTYICTYTYEYIHTCLFMLF